MGVRKSVLLWQTFRIYTGNYLSTPSPFFFPSESNNRVGPYHHLFSSLLPCITLEIMMRLEGVSCSFFGLVLTGLSPVTPEWPFLY